MKVDPPRPPSQGVTVVADALVLTGQGRLVLQRRPLGWGRFAGAICLFGGHVEDGETTLEGVRRELTEELGATPYESELMVVGVIVEDDGTEVHLHVWIDRDNRITGCYEGEAVTFATADEALEQDALMGYARVAIRHCADLGLT